MARKRKKNRHGTSRPKGPGQREYHRISHPEPEIRRDLLDRPVSASLLHKRKDRINGDRRHFDPDSGLHAFTKTGVRAKIISRDSGPNQKNLAPSERNKTEFVNPGSVSVCKRRKQRRETLFKRGKIGKGIAGPKIKLYTEISEVRCK